MAPDPADDPLVPGFLADLSTIPMEELRRRRGVTDEIETGYSYLRRLIQGRLDIVTAEHDRRAAGEPAGDIAALVERLPDILGENVHAPGLGRLPHFLAPGELDPELERRLDALITPAQLAALPGCSDEELAGFLDGLSRFEREVSSHRHALHVVLDQLQAEIVRRYRDGEATGDDLLP